MLYDGEGNEMWKFLIVYVNIKKCVIFFIYISKKLMLLRDLCML